MGVCVCVCFFFFGESKNGIEISDHLDHGASKEPTNPLWTRIHRFLWSIKGNDESTLDKDSSVPLMHHDLNVLRSQIRFWILPQKSHPMFTRDRYWINRARQLFLPVNQTQHARSHLKTGALYAFVRFLLASAIWRIERLVASRFVKAY